MMTSCAFIGTNKPIKCTEPIKRTEPIVIAFVGSRLGTILLCENFGEKINSRHQVKLKFGPRVDEFQQEKSSSSRTVITGEGGKRRRACWGFRGEGISKTFEGGGGGRFGKNCKRCAQLPKYESNICSESRRHNVFG